MWDFIENMVNAPITPCIISTHEAQALAAGNSLTLAVLGDGVCPALRQADVTALQDRFKHAFASPIKAMAYLWRPTSVEAIRTDQLPVILEACQSTATPLRCEAVKAYAEGHMSRMVIEEEIRSTGMTECDWRTRLAEQDRNWLNYVHINKSRMGGEIDVDGQLLGSLILMSEFVEFSGFVFSNSPRMQDMACFQQVDCNVVSTRVIDHLRQAGQMVSGQIAVVDIPKQSGQEEGHQTLQFTISSGNFLYFNNGTELLPKYEFQGMSRNLDPWQILSGHYLELSNTLLIQGDFSGGLDKVQKALAIDPKNVDVYAEWGEALLLQGDEDGAIDKFQKALALDPQNIVANAGLAGLAR